MSNEETPKLPLPLTTPEQIKYLCEVFKCTEEELMDKIKGLFK
jgi:hypothetical protein